MQRNNREEIKYITTDELENKNIRGVLVLKSSFFQIVKVILDKDLDDRERELEIEEQLENRIEDYDPLEYIEKELPLNETSDEEEIAVILLKRSLLYELLEKATKNKIEILGIIPIFLLGFTAKKEKKKEIFIYTQSERTTAVIFEDRELKDLISIEIEREEFFYEGAEEFLEKVTYNEIGSIERIHLCEEDSELEEKFIPYAEVIIDKWKNTTADFEESCSFLPQEHRDGLKKKKYIKVLGVGLLAILILEFAIGFSFDKIKNDSMKNTAKLQNEIGIYKEKINNKRKKIEEFKDYREETEKLTEKMSFSNIKLNILLDEIKKCQPVRITNSTIEYDSKKTLRIIGEAVNEKDIIEFEKRILQSPLFIYLNHDYIIRDENSYLFQLDIEVKNERNR